ncbi:MAG: Bug family tripartite tricarboxylate transporter substrate binding protein [Pigmentiphaga sp.]
MKSIRNRVRTISAALGLISSFFVASTAVAAYPEKPVRLLIPFTAGGPTDHLARMVGQRLGEVLGQPVIADNRPGANSIVAIQTLMQAQPDGYTLFFAGLGPLVLTPALYKTLPYDAERDLVPVGPSASMPLVMLVNPDLPVENLDEFIAYAKERPGELNYGSPGVGNPLHLSVEMFTSGADIDMHHIPFNGTAPALTSLIGGEIHTVFDVIQSALPFIESGRLRPLAVTTPERNGALPDVPTFDESGFPGYSAGSWYVVAAPAGTPEDVQQVLNDALRKVVAEPGFASSVEKLGLIPHPPMDFEQMDTFIEGEKKRWGEIIEANEFTLD